MPFSAGPKRNLKDSLDSPHRIGQDTDMTTNTKRPVHNFHGTLNEAPMRDAYADLIRRLDDAITADEVFVVKRLRECIDRYQEFCTVNGISLLDIK